MTDGDEVVTHALVTNARHPHKCFDSCYEVRTLQPVDDFVVYVSDILSGVKTLDLTDLEPAPIGLLVRKNAFYARMKHIVDVNDGADQNAAGHVLDHLKHELDAYLFADHASARMWPGVPGPKVERLALDAAAIYIVEHARSVFGRPRHHILADVRRALENA